MSSVSNSGERISVGVRHGTWLLVAFIGCWTTSAPVTPPPVASSAATSAAEPILWPTPEAEHVIFGLPTRRTWDPYDAALRVRSRLGYVIGHYATGRVPAWTSYHLTKDYVDGQEFIPRAKLSWKADPDLPAEERAEDSDYTKSGYSRGHMAMQSDLRGRSEACEREGYYLSNTCPQTQAFNDGIWKSLENQCKAWARTYGEVWILCGPLFTTTPLRRLQGETANRVAIPDAFYKLVVRKDGDQPVVLAFVFPHEPEPNRKTPLQQFLTSVDEIEKQGALDFFPDLPDTMENAIEAETPTMLWPSPSRN